MAKPSTASGKPSSATESTPSRSPKPVLSFDEGPKTYVVSHPLPPLGISWLRQQSKHVAEVSKSRLSRMGELRG